MKAYRLSTDAQGEPILQVPLRGVALLGHAMWEPAYPRYVPA